MRPLIPAVAALSAAFFCVGDLRLPTAPSPLKGISTFAGFTLFLFVVQVALRGLVRRYASADTFRHYAKYDGYTYLSFLFSASFLLGVRASIPVAYAFAVLFGLSQAGLILAPGRRPTSTDPRGGVYCLFFLSGFAALIYQLCWQRALFQLYGVTTESVTAIVSIFMLGLGIGSLAGGALSRRFGSRLHFLFLLCELGTALFGLLSLPAVAFLGRHFIRYSTAELTLLLYGFFLVPTLLMGATLPILVTLLHRRGDSVGNALGSLYFVNTLGSALATLLTVDVLYLFVGLQGAVFLAAACNALVAALIFRLPESGGADQPAASRQAEHDLPFAACLFLSFALGFLSLSQEIIWVRAIGFATASMPQVFGHILAAVLAGIAFGALLGRRLSRMTALHPLYMVCALLTVSGTLYFLALPAIAATLRHSRFGGVMISYAAISLVSLCLGSGMVLLSHFGIRERHHVGRPVSWIYFANVLGSTAGPLLTGFYLLEKLSLQNNMVLLSLGTLLLAALSLLLHRGATVRARAPWMAMVCGLLALMLAGKGVLYRNVLEKLFFKREFSGAQLFTHVEQNRAGIITAYSEPGRDVINGNGGFDTYAYQEARLGEEGPASPDFRRFFFVAAIHPHPRKVLEIAVSIGTYAQVLASYGRIESLQLVEINPAYRRLAAHYPGSELWLQNPKVNLQIDDGRRWLKRNPDTRFDLIAMNIPHHFRSQISNLLSAEFFRMCREHLLPGGVLYVTVTGSEDAIFTAAQVFRHVSVYDNLFVASDEPLLHDPKVRAENFDTFTYAGKPVFTDASPPVRASLESMIHEPLPDLAEAYRHRTDLELVTDNNMLTEFRKAHGPFAELYRWR